MNGSVRIGRIWGIPIKLHLTFLIILPLFVFVFSTSEGRLMGIDIGFASLDADWTVSYAFGTAAAVVFFIGIVAHELAHSYVAIRYGVRIKSITLMLFGGVASMEEIPKKPGQELKMSFAGPLTSLGIGLGSYGGMVVTRAVGDGSVTMDGLAILFGLIAFYNILLAGFNLLPAFPMDGGRMLRSYLAKRMPYLEATKKAAKVGRYIAIVMGIVGIFVNIFLIIIAFFIYFGAKEEEQATTITDSLEGLRVRQIMTSDVQVVHPDISVQQLLDLMLSTHRMGFPVAERDIVGIVTLTDVQKVAKEMLPVARVRDVMTKEVVSVHPDMDAAQALKVMAEKKVGRLLVMDGRRLSGIVTKKDFLRAVDVMLARRQGLAWQHYPPGGAPPAPPPPSPPTASS